MALTILEASKINSGDVKKDAIIEMFPRNSDILRVLPFEDIAGGALAYDQEGSLPGVGFRGINEAYAESVGILNPQTEVLRIAGGDLDVDKALIKTRGMSVRSTHEAGKVKAMALHFTGKFVNGNSQTDTREFDGIRQRIGGDQLHTAGTNGAAASLFQLQDMIDSVDSPNYLMMSKQMRNRLSVAARSGVGGDITYSLDEFGRQVTEYNGIPILIADMDNLGAKIIDFNETTGSSSVTTSIYALSIGDNMLSGIQNGSIEVTDLGELDSKPVLRTRVEWLASMAVFHGRAAGRYRGILNAAVVA